MLQMNGALFSPRAAVRGSIQPGLDCAAALFPQDSLSLDTAGRPLNGAARHRSRLPTPSTPERCCSLLISGRRGGALVPLEPPKGAVTAAHVRTQFLALARAKHERDQLRWGWGGVRKGP